MAKSRNQVIFRRGKTAKIVAQDNDEGYQSYGEPIYDEDKGYLYTGIRKQVVDENEIERTVYPHAKELFPIKVRTVQGWYTDDTNSQSLESPSSATATNKVQSKDVRDYSITGDWHVSGGNNDVLRIKTTGRIEFNQNGDTLEDPVLRLDTRNSVNRALVDAKGYLESTNIRTTNIKGISGNDLITLTDDTTATSRKVDINKVGDTSIGNDDTTATRALTIYNNTTIGQNLANKYRNLTVNGNLGITGCSLFQKNLISGKLLKISNLACYTSASTASKTAALTFFGLNDGDLVGITFTNGNTAINPTLNIENTGVYPIKYNGWGITSAHISEGMLAYLYFTGNSWELLNPAGSSDNLISLGKITQHYNPKNNGWEVFSLGGGTVKLSTVDTEKNKKFVVYDNTTTPVEKFSILSASGNTEIAGTLKTKGTTTIENDDDTSKVSALESDGALQIYGGTAIRKQLRVHDKSSFTGLTTHNGGLTVAKGQISNLLGNVNLGQAGDNSNYADNSYIFYGKILGAKYSKTSSTIIDNSTIKLGDAEGQIEAKYLKGTTSITGGSLSATTGSFTSTLIVTGATTLKSTLNVTGKTTLSSLEATSGSFSGILKTSSTDSKAFVVGEDKFYVSGSTGDITTDGTLNSLYLQSPNISSIYLSRTDQSSKTSNLSTTVLGAGALNTLTDGSYNTAIGYCSLNKNEQGQYNTGVGYNSIASNKTTNYNTALGHQALMYSVADFNTGVGANALRYASTGATDAAKGNTAVGCYALSGLTTGPTNVAIGYNALGIGTSIANNVAIGNGSGSTMTTGSQCVLIGANTAPGTSTGVNQIVIGYNTTGVEDNSVVIGNNDINSTYLKGITTIRHSDSGNGLLRLNNSTSGTTAESTIAFYQNGTAFWTLGKSPGESATNFGIYSNRNTTNGSHLRLTINETGYVSVLNTLSATSKTTGCLRLSGGLGVNGNIHCVSLYTDSDIRLKDEIEEYKSENSILDLDVKQYTWKDSNRKSFGVIAQDVRKLFPEIINESEEGYLSVEENKLSYLLLIELKKIRKELDELKSNKKIKKILSKK